MQTEKKPRKINILGIIRLEGEMTITEILLIMILAMTFVIVLVLLFRNQPSPALSVYRTIVKASSFVQDLNLRGP